MNKKRDRKSHQDHLYHNNNYVIIRETTKKTIAQNKQTFSLSLSLPLSSDIINN